MLHLPTGVLVCVRVHAAAAYPEECCGALFGRDATGRGSARIAVSAIPAENRFSGPRQARFLIPAAEVRVLEARAAAGGLSLIGFYHSHPQGRAEPSEVDRAFAWPWYSYLIVPVRAGVAGRARSWRLADDRHAFIAEHLVTVMEAS